MRPYRLSRNVADPSTPLKANDAGKNCGTREAPGIVPTHPALIKTTLNTVAAMTCFFRERPGMLIGMVRLPSSVSFAFRVKTARANDTHRREPTYPDCVNETSTPRIRILDDRGRGR